MITVGDNPNTCSSITVSNIGDWITVPATTFPYDCSGGMYAVNKNMVDCIENVLHPCRIEKVIFHDPATIVIWKDKTKTVVKCHNEPYDREKGLAMCIAKKVLGDKFHSTFREWCKEEEKDGNCFMDNRSL